MTYLPRVFCILGLVLVGIATSSAQWAELYATWDDPDTNGTGWNTPAVGVIKENTFVALVASYGTTNANFMIPYVDADSSHGRKNYWGYGSALDRKFQYWNDGLFIQIPLTGANQLFATPDSFLYVANNDPLHNILVFKFTADTILTVEVPGTGVMPRQETGSNTIWAVAVDKNGYVYACNDTTTGMTDDIKIYPPLAQWTANNNDPPLRTVDLPDGIYKGITVSPNGNQIFVSDYENRKVLRFRGSPTTGYTADAGFNFALGIKDTIPTVNVPAHPMGLAYLAPNNIVAVACHAWRGGTSAYEYGRIYMIDANTGTLISSDSSVYLIDQAAWNYALTGGYNMRTNGKTPGNASGYTSTYDVKFDEKGFLYSQSYYGWTVEKWKYNGTLPSFTGVEELGNILPGGFRLEQNYPNPFNPSTRIEFALPKQEFVVLRVYDILGREVATLVNETQPAGAYRVTFDAKNVPSGTYFYSLKAGSFNQTKTMVVVK